MNTRKKRELASDVLDNCSFKSPEPKKRKSNKKEPSAKPINLSSSVIKSSDEKVKDVMNKIVLSLRMYLSFLQLLIPPQ